MKKEDQISAAGAAREAASQLKQAASAKKCWPCGCLHNTVEAIGRALPEGQAPSELREVLAEAKGKLTSIQYDCLGCEICWPALAINALSEGMPGLADQLETCPTEKPAERLGWPPLAGSYDVLRYQAPVAVCTLTNDTLMQSISNRAPAEVSMVGTMFTENLGIERVIQNVITNPNIRYVIVCGEDSLQRVGHLPGQSLISLSENGLDEHMRIIGARGKRPIVRNVSREAVAHFRANVEVVDLVGTEDVATILETAVQCARRNPGPAAPHSSGQAVTPLRGYIPEHMTSDPSGYFVVFVDQARGVLTLEHYQNHGVLDTIIEGSTAAEIYCPVVERNLLSRLDHAAYLGRELARAEQALESGEPYVQDAAPEQTPRAVSSSCGCSGSC